MWYEDRKSTVQLRVAITEVIKHNKLGPVYWNEEDEWTFLYLAQANEGNWISEKAPINEDRPNQRVFRNFAQNSEKQINFSQQDALM